MKGMCCRSVSVMTVVLAVVSIFVGSVVAAPLNAASNYEIPLVELQKVKKERPPKRESRERKRKKSEAPLPEQKPYGVVVQPETASTPKGNEVEKKPESVTKQAEGPLSIHHDPYSYLLTGKRTVIQAIISGTNSIVSVYCRFRAGENGGYARVPMTTMPGTYFTYSATLPGLAPASTSLRYAIVAVDAVGNEMKSAEFEIPAKASVVLPGWQLEGVQEPLKITLESKERPLEGFSDPNLPQ